MARRRDDDDDDYRLPRSGSWRDDDYDDRDRPRRRRSSFGCPHCDSTRAPRRIEKTSTIGWALFGVLLGLGVISLFAGCLFFPCWFGVVAALVCWTGFLIKDSYRECIDCGERLN